MITNKEKFIAQLVENFGYTRQSATMIVDDFWACVLNNLETGTPVSFHGIGRFDFVGRAEKRFFNPTTGKTTVKPEHRSLRFTPGKMLKRATEKSGHPQK